jgi:4-hydroxythreonine-4-phosphate dehydrogenase
LHSLSDSYKTLGITTGDPAGIGPEVTLRALHDESLAGLFRCFVFGDSKILQFRANQIGIPFDFEVISGDQLFRGDKLGDRTVVHVPAMRHQIECGKGSKASGVAAALNVIECAAACSAGLFDAMVTAPLSKKHLEEAGYDFPGHTEFLAHLSQTPSVAMAFLTERLKVVLLTVHMSLKEAIERIRPDVILEKLELLLREFPLLGLPCRRIGVAGLNPHAGETGLFGTEESEQIEPAIIEARLRHGDAVIEGPLPADSLFYRAAQGDFDVVLALYHDQGLAPIKLLGFGDAVNVTLGLPFVRTSVDHGTAFELAPQYRARPDGMISAIRWALKLISPQ